jgi:hypothetical protein
MVVLLLSLRLDRGDIKSLAPDEFQVSAGDNLEMPIQAE